ncbi:ankyrin repeat domain-containing protein [Fusarium mexicanum]|uniref:Ankyrin repeat domain-containing protein n=1 Tax=Fusarium mexicanum TaxID=751941 RepID=A0A8H5JPH9_9HYPO|nr:ankyrin repeat domain-containing protein [Fusarium mexicanum]
MPDTSASTLRDIVIAPFEVSTFGFFCKLGIWILDDPFGLGRAGEAALTFFDACEFGGQAMAMSEPMINCFNSLAPRPAKLLSSESAPIQIDNWQHNDGHRTSGRPCHVTISVNAMAEAIGLVASVASLLDLALKLSNSLHNLQFQFRNAPYLIQALKNETEATRTVLARVETSIHSAATARLGGPGNSGILSDLTAEIGKGAAVLKDLDIFVDGLNNETSTLRRVKWVHKRERASGLIKDLKEVRSRISELQLAYGNLGACLLDTRDQITADRDTTFQNQSDITAALEALQNTTPNLPPEWVDAISNQLATSINTIRPGLAKDNITDVSPHQSHRQQITQAICSPLQHCTLAFKLKLMQSQCSIGLFENPVAVFDIDLDGNSAMHASIQGFLPWELTLQIWEVLLQAGADPDQVNADGLSFRHKIANQQLQNDIPFEFQPEVQKLVQISQCLEDIDLTFIHEVVVKRCPIDIGPVLKSGKSDILAQIHSGDRFGMTPLMYAVALGDAKAAEALIEAGASVHKKGPFGRNLVDYAGHLPSNTCAAILDLLLAAGANAIDAFPTGWSLLHTAAIRDNVIMIDRLLQEGAQTDCIGPRGNLPIHYAASHNSVNAVRLLHEKGADVNALADNGLSSLGVAIQKNASDAQAALLELGADHRITGDWGTYLHVAAYWGNERTFNTLSCLKLMSLDVDARDAEGLTATDVYESRYDKTDELTRSFCQLRNSIIQRSPDDYSSEDEVGDTDQFFDACEFSCDNGLC